MFRSDALAKKLMLTAIQPHNEIYSVHLQLGSTDASNYVEVRNDITITTRNIMKM